MNYLTKFYCLLSIFAFGGLGLFGATITTTPVGYATVTIQGTGGLAERQSTYLATPMVRAVVWKGVVEAVEGRRIRTTTPLDLAEGLSSESEYYLEVTSGTRIGYTAALDTDGSVLQTHRDLSGFFEAGDTFAIRPYPTLARVFAAPGGTILQAGVTPAEADQVLIPDPESGRLEGYFPSRTPSGSVVWARIDGQPLKSDPILYPASGLIVRRIAEDDVRLVLSGDVSSHPAVIPVEVGINLIASGFPGAVTLDKLFGPEGGGFVAGTSPTDADTVSVPGPYGDMTTYFRKTPAAGGPGWFTSDAFEAQGGQVVIDSGEVLLVNRTQGPAFNLRLHQPVGGQVSGGQN